MTSSFKSNFLGKLKVGKNKEKPADLQNSKNRVINPLPQTVSSSCSSQRSSSEILSPTSEFIHESPSFSCGVLELLEDEETVPVTSATCENLKRSPIVDQKKSIDIVFDEEDGATQTEASCSNSQAASQSSTMDDFRNDLEGDLGRSNSSSKVFKRRSRLSKSFGEVLKDPGALGFFIQYMDTRHLGHLVKFYLAAESFHVSASAVYNSSKKDLDQGSRKAADRETSSRGFCNEEMHNNDSNAPSDENGTSHAFKAIDSDKADSGISMGLKEMTERDAVSIFAKYIGKDANSSIGVTESIRNTVINKICTEQGCLDPECFSPAQEFVRHIMEHRYFPDFVGSVYYCKHQMDVLTSGSVTLADILFNESALSYFTEFLDMKGHRRLVAFWLVSDSFKQDLIRRQGIYSGMEAQNDAMVLYDRYFSMQGTEPLNLGERVRIEVENNICREGGPLPDCFDNAARIVYAILEKELLPKFLQSSLFVKYLSELIHTIRNSFELPDPNRPRKRLGSTTGSDVSSGSIGSSVSLPGIIRNTLLAQESPHAIARRRQASQVSSDQMSLDALSYGGQDLYERPSSKLSFGKVDQFGQYIREYDEATGPPTRKGKNMVAEKMKKLVNKDTKEQEDLALQVAQLIVNDVTQMTQSADAVPR